MAASKRYVIIGIAVATTLVLGSMFLGVAAANHGQDQNATMVPYVDGGDDNRARQPGAENVGMQFYASNIIEVEILSFNRYKWSGVDASDCSGGDIKAFGIDRGNNRSGLATDESLLNNYKDATLKAKSSSIKYWEEEQLAGEPTHVNRSDQVVAAVGNCYDMPDQAGWYQWNLFINGTGWDGTENVTTQVNTHYFWICDCENEQEARETLGPPPSQRSSNGGPTPTPTSTPESQEETTPADTEASENEQTATATERSNQQTATQQTSQQTDANANGGQSSGGGGNQQGTPTPSSADGPGFTGVAAIVALLAAVLLGRRR